MKKKKKYEQTEDALRALILALSMSGETTLPTEEELCRRYQVSRQTLRHALDNLKAEGLLHSVRGGRTSLAGSALNPAKNRVVLLYTPKVQDLYPDLLRVVQQKVGAFGLTIESAAAAHDFGKERAVLEELLLSPPRGVIAQCLYPLENPNLDLYRKLREKKVPVVFAGNTGQGEEGFPFVGEETRRGAALLVDALYQRGHRNIAGLFPLGSAAALERLEGFLLSLRERNLSLSRSRVLLLPEETFGESGHDTYQAMQRFLLTLDEACTAVVCNDEDLALRLYQAKKKTLPERRVTIACFDQRSQDFRTALPFLSIHHGERTIAGEAAEVLIKQMAGETVKPVLLPWEIEG